MNPADILARGRTPEEGPTGKSPGCKGGINQVRRNDKVSVVGGRQCVEISSKTQQSIRFAEEMNASQSMAVCIKTAKSNCTPLSWISID